MVRKNSEKADAATGACDADSLTALRQSEERHRTILRTAMDGICLVGGEGRLLEVNDAYCKMVGYGMPELLTMHISDLEVLETGNTTATHIQKIVEQGEDRFETRHRRKDGSMIDVEVSVQFRPDDDGRFIVFLHDVSERKQMESERAKLEAQLRQAAKMESVGRLAGGVAHDFNNMLGVILGHTELALEQVDPSLALHSNLVEIRKAAQHSADLTRQLLAFGRKQPITPVVLDLNEIMAGMLKMLVRLIGEDIDLVWKPGANLWPVKADPSQIDQILANLCANARDAIADVGKLTLETENIIMDEAFCSENMGAVPGEYVLISASDNGCGIDKETLTHLFEPFFTTKEMGKGTGLGLATVYGIVKQNNGYIEVSSEPGQGTTFRIYLPHFAGKTEQAPLHGAAKPVPSCGKTILLVEDEPALLKMVAMTLERQGLTVLSASTPEEAIRLAKEHDNEIHLIITDVIMPEMNGWDLAKYLLTLHPRLNFLFMSGYPASHIANDSMLDIELNFIHKPFHVQDFTTHVLKVLDKPGGFVERSSTLN